VFLFLAGPLSVPVRDGPCGFVWVRDPARRVRNPAAGGLLLGGDLGPFLLGVDRGEPSRERLELGDVPWQHAGAAQDVRLFRVRLHHQPCAFDHGPHDARVELLPHPGAGEYHGIDLPQHLQLKPLAVVG